MNNSVISLRKQQESSQFLEYKNNSEYESSESEDEDDIKLKAKKINKSKMQRYFDIKKQSNHETTETCDYKISILFYVWQRARKVLQTAADPQHSIAPKIS